MDKWLLVVESNCKDETREAELDQWYDNVHIPDILSGSPGFKRAAQYLIKRPQADKGKYLTVYEIETDDIDATIAAHGKNMKRLFTAGRNSELVEMVSWSFSKIK
jgi:hypothetical protein